MKFVDCLHSVPRLLCWQNQRIAYTLYRIPSRAAEARTRFSAGETATHSTVGREKVGHSRLFLRERERGRGGIYICTTRCVSLSCRCADTIQGQRGKDVIFGGARGVSCDFLEFCYCPGFWR